MCIRFYQSGTCANGSNCRFSHGQPDQEPIRQLTIQMDSFTFDQSDGSEGSYEASLGSFDTNGYPDLAQSITVDSGFLDPTIIDGVEKYSRVATFYSNFFPILIKISLAIYFFSSENTGDFTSSYNRVLTLVIF